MKKLIIILTVLITASCQPQEPGRSTRFKTMMIKATGEVETLPNLATFRIQLNCLDKSIKSSKKCLVDKSNELNKRLLSFGISQDDILTTSVDMNKSYSWRSNTRIFEGYNSSTVLYITVKDLNKLDEIYTELIENRNLDISGLAYSHSQLDSLKNEAYLNALRNSKVLADKLISELPESEKEILKIGNVEISASVPESAEQNFGVGNEVMQSDARAQNQAIAISKGTVSVHATLYVEFQIK